MENEPVVFVVDNDSIARESMGALLSPRGVRVRTYASSERFLEGFDRSQFGCLIVDARMPSLSGLELLEKLRADDVRIPVIVVAERADVPSAVRAMRAGAVTFLEKPCADYELWESVDKALRQCRRERLYQTRRAELNNRLARLTEQEHRVMEMMLDGIPNRTIAAELGIGLRTAELRRSRVMKKMEARSLAELVRLSVEAEELSEGAA